jgi:hypothetical protein
MRPNAGSGFGGPGEVIRLKTTAFDGGKRTGLQSLRGMVRTGARHFDQKSQKWSQQGEVDEAESRSHLCERERCARTIA